MAGRNRQVLGLLGAAVALFVVVGCTQGGAPQPLGGTATAPMPSAGAGATGPAGDQQAVLTQAYQNALAVTQLGALGGAQGAAEQVRSLGGDVEQFGTRFGDQIRTLAAAQQVTLEDTLPAAAESTLTQLRGQSGPPFDAAWLRAVQQAQHQARDWATGVLNDPNASPDAKGAARDLLAGLDAVQPRLDAALAAAGTGGNTSADASGSGSGSGSDSGSGTPRSVDAGTGGQASSPSEVVLPGALVALGAVLLGFALVRLRRSSRP